MREDLADARETSGGKENVEAAVMVRGGGEIEPASAMLGPRLASEGRVKGDDKLARGMDGMGGKVVGSTMEREKEGDNRLEGRHIGRGGAEHHGVKVDVPMMQDDE